MSEPVAERIMAAIKTRVAVYTSAFRSTAVATWQPKDLTIHVYQGEIVKNEELSYAGNPPAQAWDMEAIVAGLVKPSDTDTTAVDTLKNRFHAEIIKAATIADQWHTWGDLAINTTIGQVEDYTSDDGSFGGVKVVFLVTFRTDENNPFNVRS